MVYILAALIIFGVLIAVHEWGHYIAARLCGVTVHEFAIGMGPKLYHKEKNGCLYTLRLLPIGGYCALEGEEEESDDPHSLNNQNLFKKVVIFAAGAFMNFVAGLVIILILFANAGGFYTAEVVDVREDFAYGGESGIQVGDVIYRVDGHRIYTRSDVELFLGRGDGQGYNIEVLRDGERIDVGYIPLTEYTQEDGSTAKAIGITIGGVEEGTIWAKLKYSWYQAIDFVRLVWISLGDLITGAVGVDQLSGPVGIVDALSQVGSDPELSPTVWDAVWNIGYFAALIAVNLAVMNLMPIPALDGCKIFFLVVNAVAMLLFKRQIPPKYENYIHAAGFVLLMGLMVVVTFQDVWRIIK